MVWRESIKTDDLVERVKHTIKEEVANNKSSIEAVLGYHETLAIELLQNRHLINKFALNDLDVDVTDDRAFEAFFKKVLLFTDTEYTDRVEVHREEDLSVLVLNNRIFQLEIDGDSLVIYGDGNIKLRTADISNNSWGIAEATNALVELDVDIVSDLSRLKSIQDDYMETSNKAIDLVYQGEPGVVHILEDMINYEKEMLRLDSLLLTKIQ